MERPAITSDEDIIDLTAEESEETELKRVIGPRMLVLFILGDTLGAGVYVLIGQVAATVNGAVWAPLLLALFFAMLTAFSYAELGTKFPRAGGAAVYAHLAFRRPLLSFLVGFTMMSAGLSAAASLAVAFAGDYLGEFITVPRAGAAVAFIGLVALLNLRGIEESVKVNMVLTTLEAAGLLLAIALGFMTVASGAGVPQQAVRFPTDTALPVALLGGAVLAFYAFMGFEASANMAEETTDPRRTFPRALFTALAVAGIIYTLLGLALSMSVPVERLRASSAPLLEVLEVAPVFFPPRVFSVIALLAVSNGALLYMIVASRLVYGMAEERLVPSVFGRILPNRRTPWAAIAVTTVLAIALILSSDLTALAETTVLLLVIVYAFVNLSVIALRRVPVHVKHYRAPRFMPYVALAVCILVMTQQSAAVWARAGVMLLIGLVLYVLTRLVLGHEHAVSA
jgi:APA family basic amino acid/polyamine antiporter